jgi:hypothetical protein
VRAQALAPGRGLRSSHVLLIAAADGLLVLFLRDWLEIDMTRHMLLEFPLLLIAGALVGHALDERFRTPIERCNRLGLLGFVFASLVLTYWMIPAALDAALLNGWVAAGKYASLVLGGVLLRSSFRVAPLPLQAFFVGNFAWMTATIGLIYQSAPQQLCLNYLPEAQWSAGEAIVAAAVIAGCSWGASVALSALLGGRSWRLGSQRHW